MVVEFGVIPFLGFGGIGGAILWYTAGGKFKPGGAGPAEFIL